MFWVLFSSLCSATTPAEEKLFQDIAEIKAILKVFMEQRDKRFKGLRRT